MMPPKKPSLAIKEQALSSLKVYDKNPRRNDAQVPRMVELLKAFGFRVPILVRGDRIVDGHLRYKAALKMGMTHVPTIDVGDMPSAAEKALRIALNKSVEWAEWDTDLLGQEMVDILAGGLDLTLTGFEASEASDLIAKLSNDAMTSGAVTKTKQADAGLPADPLYVSVTFQMTDKNRTAVLAALEAYREANKLTNHSQALVSLCAEWEKGKG